MSIVTDHFAARAGRYDRSSSWCQDDELGALTVEHVAAGPRDRLLDVACGTGLVARRFKGRVAEVVGVDITPAMFEQARPHLDTLVVAPGEDLPFADASFDRVVCRQGIQFMDDHAAVAEMVRVTRPGGRVVLVQLVAYGEADRAEYFEVLRLRNPARRNFYLPGDVERLLREAGARRVTLHRYVSVEDVDAWSDNGAIEEARREGIREIYRQASPAFSDLHAVEVGDKRIVDHMLFVIAVGEVG